MRDRYQSHAQNISVGLPAKPGGKALLLAAAVPDGKLSDKIPKTLLSKRASNQSYFLKGNSALSPLRCAFLLVLAPACRKEFQGLPNQSAGSLRPYGSWAPVAAKLAPSTSINYQECVTLLGIRIIIRRSVKSLAKILSKTKDFCKIILSHPLQGGSTPTVLATALIISTGFLIYILGFFSSLKRDYSDCYF